MTGALRLREIVPGDITTLMSWFGDALGVSSWGGPFFRYPFDAETFDEDVRWRTMASYGLADGGGEMLAFGQFYERYGRINLARLVVHPAHRGRGLGSRLVGALLEVSRQRFALDEYSLFVYRNNLPAIACYRAAGFRQAEFPADAPLADRAIYMTRPVEPAESAR